MDRSLIDQYEAGAANLKRAVAGLTPADLDAFPVPGTWSIRQIVLHLLDSDLHATTRVRRMVCEDNPLLIAYDENLASQRCHYDKTDFALALELFDLNRRFTAQWLRLLPDDAFGRTGVHNQNGKITVETIVRNYARHVDHHLEFVFRKRALLGKPLPPA